MSRGGGGGGRHHHCQTTTFVLHTVCRDKDSGWCVLSWRVALLQIVRRISFTFSHHRWKVALLIFVLVVVVLSSPPPSIWFDFPLSLSLHLLLCKKWEVTITNRRPVGGWEKEIFCFSALTVRYFSLFRRATRAQLYTSVLLPPLLLQCPAKNK